MNSADCRPNAPPAPSFEARAESALIYFSVTDLDPNVAAKLANAWAVAFIDEIDERSRSGGEIMEKSLATDLAEKRKAYEEKTKALTDFLKNKSFDPDLFKTDPIHLAVSDYEQKIRLNEEMLTTLETEVKLIADPANNPAMFVAIGRCRRRRHL